MLIRRKNRNFINAFYASVLIIIFLASASGASAQISINAIGASYSQNFNSLASATSWTNNSTLPGWYAANTAGNSMAVIQSSGSSHSGGLYSFGTAGSPDRALGAINTTQTKDYYYGVRMKNTSASTITAFYISFTGEQWRNSGKDEQDLPFSFRISSSAITSPLNASGVTWTPVPSLTFYSPIFGGKHGAYKVPSALDGNATANKQVITYLISNIELLPGHEIMFRWFDTKHKKPNHALAIDDFTVQALAPVVFHAKSSGNLNDLATWGRNQNGSGTNPTSFSNPNNIFHINNSSGRTISNNWIVNGSGSKVVLTNSTFTIPATAYFQGTIDVGSGSTLIILNSEIPTIGQVGTGSNIVYGAATDQVLAGHDYGNLYIYGGGIKSLSNSTTVTGTLAFYSGKIDLGAYDLRIMPGGVITGAGSTNYIIAGGSGSLIREVKTGNTTVLFPVGLATDYSPVTLSQPNNGESDNFYVRLQENLYGYYDSSDAPLSLAGDQTIDPLQYGAIGRTYVIGEENEGGSNLTITLQWNALTELAQFDRNKTVVAHYTNGIWEEGAYAPATSLGNNQYSRTTSGFTSFSPFTVSSTEMSSNIGNNPLPVELINFRATQEKQLVELSWQTASETDNDYFEVQRSADGRNWNKIGQVAGNGTTENTSDYLFIDPVNSINASIVYYRLRQVDFNGDFSFSPAVAVRLASEKALSLNNFNNLITGNRLTFNFSADSDKAAGIEIYSTSGQLIHRQQITILKGNSQTEITGNNIAAGQYIYRITTLDDLPLQGQFIKY